MLECQECTTKPGLFLNTIPFLQIVAPLDATRKSAMARTSASVQVDIGEQQQHQLDFLASEADISHTLEDQVPGEPARSRPNEDTLLVYCVDSVVLRTSSVKEVSQAIMHGVSRCPEGLSSP